MKYSFFLRFISLFSVVFLCLTLQACSAVRMQENNSLASLIGELPEQDTMQNIADDITDYIKEVYPPGYTSIYIVTNAEKKTEDIFALTLENSLRQQGFEISEIAQVIISYTLDSLACDEWDDLAGWYIYLRFSNGQTLARAYDTFGYSASSRTQTQFAQQPKRNME